ncbi:hypothetical protein GCM10023311_00520 [Flaviramulus aquimarinus]|uniref:T9SS C-terminal target domain-containing protein n=1 Tax=Flaviramulus aquimarinus TaxID=1170456 RepID=A0ABP9EMI7_9FLAO
MKSYTQIVLIFLLATLTAFAQQEKGIIGSNNWLNNWTEFKPNQKDYDEPTKILTGSITESTTLYKREVYLLLGSVFVTNNATLTIEPGTVIIGDFKSEASLTITKGAKIIADGIETDPIVFTSNRSFKRAGDWGGLIILGDAPTNKFGNGSVSSYYTQLNATVYANANYGGENYEDVSGILRYVRIEYAGKRLGNGNYFSGLLLAGVGNETILENIMVSYASGNAFEVWGGSVSMYNMVSYRANSNDYKFNYGSQSNLLNSLAVRSPYVSNSSGSRCLNVMSYDDRDQVDFSKNGTSVVAKNLTFVNDSENLKSEIEMGLINEAVYVGHNASLDMNKSVISGFNPAVILEDKISINQQNLEKIKFSAMYFNNCKGNIFVENNSNNEDLENWYGNSAFFNVYSKSENSETFIDLRHSKRPDFRLRINKIIASNEVDPDLRDN